MMKKLLSVLLAMALIAAIAPVTFAANSLTFGNVYGQEDDDDDYFTDDKGGTVAPGSTVWVYLGDYSKDSDDYNHEAPRSISIVETEIIDPDDDDDDFVKTSKLFSVTSKGEKKKIDSGKYAWFAKLTVKSVSTANYPEDGYDVDVFKMKFSWDGDSHDGDEFDVDISAVAYEESDEEFEDEARLFAYDKDDAVEIDLPDEDGVFTGTARKDFEVIASMNTKVNNTLLNKYPNADIRFYNGSGAIFPVSNGKLVIYADSGDYLYQVDSNNTLIDKSSSYNSSKKGFVINTTTIGKYIVSDMKLSTSGSIASSSKPAASEYIGTNAVVSNSGSSGVLVNPSTGALV